MLSFELSKLVIPVVVCDSYLYAPTFKSSLNMRDYAIFIPEKAFLEDPLRELHDRVDRSKKRQGRGFSFRESRSDHPESLFVPVFTRVAAGPERAVDP
jgi:hypothetical protein